MPPPPLLWALPGSGAAWVRLLLEYSTGYFTGSVARDPGVASILPGENHGCDRGVTCLHADAMKHPMKRLIHSPIKYVCNSKLSSIKGRFTRIVALVRNPYDLIWEAYLSEIHRKIDLPQMRLEQQQQQQQHNQQYRRRPNAINAKHGMVRLANFEQVAWRQRALALAKQWVAYLEGVEKWAKDLGPHAVLTVQVEALFSTSPMGSSSSKHSRPWLRCMALGRLLAFLGHDITSPSMDSSDHAAGMGGGGGGDEVAGASGMRGITSGERCTCAFVLAGAADWSNVWVERPPSTATKQQQQQQQQQEQHSESEGGVNKDKGGGGGGGDDDDDDDDDDEGSRTRQGVAKEKNERADAEEPAHKRGRFLGREEVYSDDPRLVCDIWHITRHRATKFAYRPYGSARCFL